MTLPPGKKYVLITQEEYDLLKTPRSIVNPEKREMQKSETSMKDVLNESGLEDDKKIKLFTRELNVLKRRYDELRQPKPLEIVTSRQSTSESAKQQANENRDTLHNNILESVPKSSKTETEMLVKHLQSRPDILKWNKDGEIIFEGRTLDGSNITDLIADSMTNRQESTTQPMFKSVFLKALSRANVPRTWIKNKSHKKYLQSYLNTVDSVDVAVNTNKEKKKQKLNNETNNSTSLNLVSSTTT